MLANVEIRIVDDSEIFEQVRKIAVVEEDFPSEVRSVNVFAKVKVDRLAAAQRYARAIVAL